MTDDRQATPNLLAKIENALTEAAATIGPWLAPLPTAWLVGQSTLDHLRWPQVVAVIAGIVIELFGLAATGQALALYEYNKTRRKSDPAAPVAFAALLVAGYFAVAVTLTVILDIYPQSARFAPAIFPALSLAGVGILALRYDHRKRLEDIEQERRERAQERERRRQEKQTPVQEPAQPDPAPLDTRGRLLAYYRQHPQASQAAAGRACGISRQRAGQLLQEMESQGIIHRNGSVKEHARQP